MPEAVYGLEAAYIRLRGWLWTLLQASALAAVVVGALRFFTPLVQGFDSPLVDGLFWAYNVTGFLPALGFETYIFGGLIATLVIAWLR